MPDHLPTGPLIVGLQGQRPSAREREWLRDPRVGGVILFDRNLGAPQQVRELCAELHALREPPLLVSVDQEGGRVQRLRDGVLRLPPMARLGALHDADPPAALARAHEFGLVLAADCLGCGIDLSYTPVLDLDHGLSTVIGDRALHGDAQVVSALAGAFIDGLERGGLRAVGKHFPGHGGLAADTHLEAASDGRDLGTLWQRDLAPYRALAGRLAAVMMAHVDFPAIDPRPAGYSPFWVSEVLRGRIGFGGAVVSDDLGMAAAQCGPPLERAQRALEAGCDLLLLCNEPQATEAVLAGLVWSPGPEFAARFDGLRPHPVAGADELAGAREALAAWSAGLAHA